MMTKADGDTNDSNTAPKSCIQLSPELQAYYESHHVNLKQKTLKRRFIRLHPAFSDTLASLKDADPKPVSWLGHGFYSLDASFSLQQSPCYQQGRVYGMDVSSGAAVAILLDDCAKPPLQALDLCCAPGLKLCMMADMLPKEATLVGVDVSESRIALCKTIVKKYQSSQEGPRIRLYHGDGTTFGEATKESHKLVLDSWAMGTCKTGKRKRMNKSARARERKQLGLLQNDKHASATKVEVYDCILVDAECSTDGSLKHIQQQAQKGSAQEIQNVRLLKQQDELVPLQQKLLLSGFELLKPGGVLVYSTCSLSVHQNEGIVQWLLHRNSSAKLIPICRFLDQSFVREGSIPGTLRFLPSTEGAGGFFVAKLEKKGTPSR